MGRWEKTPGGKDMGEVREDGQVVFDGRLLKVNRDLVRLPNGKKTTREYILHPGASAVVPILDDGRILMVKQFRYPLGQVLLEIPAGKLDPGEAPLACAHRELREETGYSAAEMTPLFSIVTTPGFTNEVIHLFVARGLGRDTEELFPDEDENLEVLAMDPAEAVRLIYAGELTDVKSVAAILGWWQHETRLR